MLTSERPVVPVKDRQLMWSAIESQLPAVQPVASPFLVSTFLRNTITPIILLLLVILGGGGTALASDAARPGDFLFPLERTIENAQLRLAFTSQARESLTRSFTEERLAELRAIIDEEITISPSNSDAVAVETIATASTTVDALEITATAFNDVTVVRMELNGQTFYFETAADTRIGTIIAIQERFPILTDVQIDAQLDFATQERESHHKDRGVVTLSSKGESRIATAVQEMLKFLDTTDLDDEHKKDLLGILSSEVEWVTEASKVKREKEGFRIGDKNSRVEIQVDDNGDSRLDVRQGGSRVRVEGKDGEVYVKTSDNDSDKDGDIVHKVNVSTSGATSTKTGYSSDDTNEHAKKKKDDIYKDTDEKSSTYKDGEEHSQSYRGEDGDEDENND